jgi:uncharacterized membrane protein
MPVVTASGGPDAEDEPRWHASLAVVAALALYVTLPSRLTVGPVWIFPVLVLGLLLPLSILAPRRHGETAAQRAASIVLVALVNLFNVVSATALIVHLLYPPKGLAPLSGAQLLIAGGQIWATNVLVFALWFWELDGGGPGRRAHARLTSELRNADFLFPQMTLAGNKARCVDPVWKPLFLDYLYVSFTNALAFSPTDTMPLTRMAKTLMLVESAISFVTMAVVIARSINILS